MKAASLHGAAVAVAFIVGVQVPAQESPSSGGSCPWVANHAAVSEWQPAQRDADAQDDAAPAEDPAQAEPAAPHPMKTVDCAAGGWRKFTAPGFDDQESCVGWVLENLRPRMLEKLPPGEAREFDFPQRDTGSGATLRTGVPLLI